MLCALVALTGAQVTSAAQGSRETQSARPAIRDADCPTKQRVLQPRYVKVTCYALRPDLIAIAVHVAQGKTFLDATIVCPVLGSAKLPRKQVRPASQPSVIQVPIRQYQKMRPGSKCSIQVELRPANMVSSWQPVELSVGFRPAV
jgi:hypothetical protein